MLVVVVCYLACVTALPRCRSSRWRVLRRHQAWHPWLGHREISRIIFVSFCVCANWRIWRGSNSCLWSWWWCIRERRLSLGRFYQVVMSYFMPHIGLFYCLLINFCLGYIEGRESTVQWSCRLVTGSNLKNHQKKSTTCLKKKTLVKEPSLLSLSLD